MKKLSLKKLNLEVDDLLKREELKTILGGYGYPTPPGGEDDLMCYNEIHYDDGYVYVVNQGEDIDLCRSLVGGSYYDSRGRFWVDSCFCTSYA